MKLIHYKILVITLTVLLVGSAVLLVQNVGLKKISSDAAGKKAIAYINANVSSAQGNASLVSISEDKSMGLYKLSLSIQNQVFESYMTLDGNTLFPDAVNLAATSQSNSSSTAPAASAAPAGTTVDGSFIKVTNPDVLKENGKPVVYFFGSPTCPHCHWEQPVIEAVTAKFGDKIVFKNEMSDKITDTDVFSKYSDGGVPTIVIAGEYYREGSGENIGAQKETDVLTKLIQQAIDQK